MSPFTLTVMSGYVDSQTWEAWFESYEVSWNNTSFIFVVSVLLSLAVVIATWMMRIPNDDSDHKQEYNERMKLQDIQEAKAEEESDNEEKEEINEKSTGNLLEFNHYLPENVEKVQRRPSEKTIETQLSAEQIMAERKAQSEQLAAIFKMMQDQEEKFGETTIDEIKDQMKLYCG